MKCKFLIVLLCSLFLYQAAQAQDTLKPLTVREVYDFQVGDVFVYQKSITYFGNVHTDYTLFKETITQKTVFQNQVIFTKEIREKNPETGIIKLSYVNDTINNLDSALFSTLKWPLPAKYDSVKDKFMTSNIIANIINSYGVDTIYQNITYPKVPIFEIALSYQRNFAKNLGMVSYNFYDAVHSVDKEGTTYKNELIYYKKNKKEWGLPDIDFNIYNIPLKKEIFDFEVGDIFTYLHLEKNKSAIKWDTLPYSRVKIIKKDISKKFIIYTKEIKNKNKNTISVFIEKDTINYLDSIIFYNIDWLMPSSVSITGCYTTNRIEYQTNFGGGVQGYNYVKWGPPIPGPYYGRGFMKGLGQVFLDKNDLTFQPQKQYYSTLIYYKKESKEWGKDKDFTISNNETYLRNSSIKIYPNPVIDGKIYFLGLEINNKNNFKCRVLDVLGKEIDNMILDSNLIDISHIIFSKGIYFIKIDENGQTITTQKICIN